jgi:hypothetical protein
MITVLKELCPYLCLPKTNRRGLVGETWEWHEGATIFCCSDPRRYNLDKSFSERLHTGKRSFADQERFRNMEYIYYNLRLMNAVPRLDGPPAAQYGKVTAQLSDWVLA